jgi:16S rRNA (adenine(1408)-N(1))-methyltransferase
VIARARAEPDALVVGIDAVATAMADASRRAARSAARGGLRNAMFVVAAAERPPAELVGLADEVTIHYPWGSLLRGALAFDEAAAAGIAALLAPRGRVTAYVSVMERDGTGLPALGPDVVAGLTARWACHGLTVDEFRPATTAEIRGAASSWARRLADGGSRPVWRLSLGRGPTDDDSDGHR